MSQIQTPQHQVWNFITLHFISINIVSCLKVMSDSRAKHMEGTPVDASCIDAPREGTSPAQWDEVPQVTTPIDVGGLVDSLFSISIGNPPRGTLEGPITNMSHETNELDVGPQQCLYCLQLDAVMVQDLLRLPPL